jgi:hypothetical protein
MSELDKQPMSCKPDFQSGPAGFRIALVLTLLGLVTLKICFVQHPSFAADTPPAHEPPRFRGSGDCMSCHTFRGGNYKDDFVLLNEYATWRLSDRHSLAYAALEGPRGQEIGRLLRQDVTKAETGCLGCHAPQSIAPPLRKQNADILRMEGVGCESCHGASEHWFGPHSEGTWRDNPGEKLKKQMIDVRDPRRKAALCYSCHLGDAAQGRVVSHAMFAAGHPPLRSVEVASFSEEMPYHWRRADKVPYLHKLSKSEQPAERKIAEAYGLSSAPTTQSRQVIASGIESLAAQLRLVATRSNLKAAQAPATWPERAMPGFKDERALASLWPQLAMAHTDCASCHHELLHVSYRQQRGYSGKPGRPPLQEWSFQLANLGLGLTDKQRESLSASLKPVFRACDARPFGDAAALAASAADATAAVQALESPKGPKPVDLLRALTDLPADAYPNFDSARQILAAIHAISEETGPQAAEVRKALADWDKKMDLDLAEARARRRMQQKLVIQVLSGVAARGGSRPALRTDDAFLDSLDAYLATAAMPEDPTMAEALRLLRQTLAEHGGDGLTRAIVAEQALRRDVDRADEERLRARLKQAQNYDPREFKALLKKLHSGLPRP